MSLSDDVSFVGQLIDAYAVGADRKSVASRNPADRGVPSIMQVGEVDAHGWVVWRVLPSTLANSEIVELEHKFGVLLPPLFRAYLLARFHLFDQVISHRHDQLILMTETPPGRPLGPIQHLLTSWQSLIPAGFIPFAEWGDGWGPMCFDIERRAQNGDCPVVWMDHEVLIPLGEESLGIRGKVLPVAKPLYDSFRELLTDVFGSATNTPIGAKGSGRVQPPSRKSWVARIAHFWR